MLGEALPCWSWESSQKTLGGTQKPKKGVAVNVPSARGDITPKTHSCSSTVFSKLILRFIFFLMWTIFEVFTEFVTISLLFYVFQCFGCEVCGTRD